MIQAAEGIKGPRSFAKSGSGASEQIADWKRTAGWKRWPSQSLNSPLSIQRNQPLWGEMSLLRRDEDYQAGATAEFDYTPYVVCLYKVFNKSSFGMKWARNRE